MKQYGIVIHNSTVEEARAFYERLYQSKSPAEFVHVDVVREHVENEHPSRVVYLCDMDEELKDFVRKRTTHE